MSSGLASATGTSCEGCVRARVEGGERVGWVCARVWVLAMSVGLASATGTSCQERVRGVCVGKVGGHTCEAPPPCSPTHASLSQPRTACPLQPLAQPPQHPSLTDLPPHRRPSWVSHPGLKTERPAPSASISLPTSIF